MNKYIRTEGPFNGGSRYPEYLNNCGHCGEKIWEVSGSKEYRRTWSEELFNKTGGREGRTYYCVPCGEKLVEAEASRANREVQEKQEEKKQKAKEVIANCLTEINSLTQKLTQGNVAGTVEDYRKIKSVEKIVRNLGNFDEPIKGEIEKLKESCRDLIETYISPKDRKIDDKNKIRSICCLPQRIKWDEENNQFYCDYCWETGDYWDTESSRFLLSLKNYHIDKLNKIMLDNGVSVAELNSSNYHSLLTAPDMILTQTGIRDSYQKAEQDLQNFLKRKGIKVDDDDKSNQIKSNQIKSNQIWITSVLILSPQ